MPEESQDNIDSVVVALAQGKLARDMEPVETATAQTLQHLTTWTATLALHMLASVPEYKARKGPGFSLSQAPASHRPC